MNYMGGDIMHFDEFKTTIKSKPRTLTEETHDHATHEYGTKTWLVLRTGNGIKFFLSKSDGDSNSKEEFSAYCTHNDKIKCVHSPEGYTLEIEYHVSDEHRFSTFLFTD